VDLGAQLIAPDDLEALEVHADHLMEEGNALGEVIAAQLEIMKLSGENLARRTVLATEARRVLAKHHEEIFGSKLAPHALSIVPKDANELTGHFAACTARWWLGVIDEVALSASSKLGLHETVPALAKIAAARFVRSMRVGSTAPPSGRYQPVEYNRFVTALVRPEVAKAFGRLRALFLGDLGEGNVASLVGAMAPIYAAFPQLEALRIHANSVDLGGLDLPYLETIELEGNCASIDALQRIERMRLWSLRNVVVSCPRSTDDFEDAIDCVSSLPHLERLTLRRFRGEGKIARILGLPRLPQLRELDLSHNALSQEIGTLIENADRFRHLERLELRFNDFPMRSDEVSRLRELLPQANVAGQGFEV
jgi:hypothetical protein